MGRKRSGGGLGWLVAGALAVGWWSSGPDDPDRPVERQNIARPSISPAPPPPSTQVRLPAPSVAVPRSAPSVSLSTMYATTRVRIRQQPSTDALVVGALDGGQRVDAGQLVGQWRPVRLGAVEGWVHGDYLAHQAPPAAFLAPVRPSAPVAPSAPRQARSGEPLRDPYVGTCDCPYDLMRNGRRCGGNSAYSKPGGRSPVCYR